jgi:hypothetical protein
MRLSTLMAKCLRPDSANGGLTPEVGSATDVAPLGRGEPKPAHELTATEDGDPVNWSRVTQLSEFRMMVRAKLRFIIPATLFFVVYYFALPVLVGYAPGLMRNGSCPFRVRFQMRQFGDLTGVLKGNRVFAE